MVNITKYKSLSFRYKNFTSKHSRFDGAYLRNDVNSIVQQKDLEYRELFHMRRVPSFQILLVLGYFHQHIHKVKRSSIQDYIIGCVFQPGLLLKQFNDNNINQFIETFERFIHCGLEFNRGSSGVSKDSIFFIRLSYMVFKYALENDKYQFSTRFDRFYEQLNESILLSNNSSVKAKLHKYRFLTSFLSLKFFPKKQKRFNDGLISYFYIQAKLTDDNFVSSKTTVDLLLAKHDFKRFIFINKNLITTDLLQDILQTLSIDANSNI